MKTITTVASTLLLTATMTANAFEVKAQHKLPPLPSVPSACYALNDSLNAQVIRNLISTINRQVRKARVGSKAFERAYADLACMKAQLTAHVAANKISQPVLWKGIDRNIYTAVEDISWGGSKTTIEDIKKALNAQPNKGVAKASVKAAWRTIRRSQSDFEFYGEVQELLLPYLR